MEEAKKLRSHLKIARTETETDSEIPVIKGNGVLDLNTKMLEIMPSKEKSAVKKNEHSMKLSNLIQKPINKISEKTITEKIDMIDYANSQNLNPQSKVLTTIPIKENTQCLNVSKANHTSLEKPSQKTAHSDLTKAKDVKKPDHHKIAITTKLSKRTSTVTNPSNHFKKSKLNNIKQNNPSSHSESESSVSNRSRDSSSSSTNKNVTNEGLNDFEKSFSEISDQCYDNEPYDSYAYAQNQVKGKLKVFFSSKFFYAI